MKKQWQKWRQIFLASLMMMLAVTLGTRAEASGNYSLALNDTFVTGNVEKGGVDWYTVKVPSTGVLTVTFQGRGVRDCNYYLLNADQTRQYSGTDVCYSSETDPKTSSQTYHLYKGTYLVKISPYGSNEGTYAVKASFQKLQTNEREPNDTFEAASTQIRSPGTRAEGTLLRDDDIDFYRICVPAAGKISITVTSMIKDIYLWLYKEDRTFLAKKDIYYASEDSPKTYTYESDYLEAGYYYIKITRYNGGYATDTDTGRYYLSWRMTSCNHVWNSGKVTTKASQSRNGVITYTCTICGETKTTTYAGIRSIGLRTTAYTYNGKACTPKFKVVLNNSKVLKSSNYTITYYNSKGTRTTPKNAGTYKAKIVFKGGYAGSASRSFKINKAAQTITNISTANVRYAAVKKKAVSFQITTKAKGTVACVRNGNAAKKYLTVSVSGKAVRVTLKKGTPKGTYKIIITGRATTNYKKTSKVVRIVVK